MKNKNLSSLKGKKKLQYIWDYYKIPLIIFCILLYMTGSILYASLTHKNAVLYTAMVNVITGETLTDQLGRGFINASGQNAAKEEVVLYTGLYLTDDELNDSHEYTYASRMKILASIHGQQLDIVLMNREAFEAFSQNGYLCSLDELLSREAPHLYDRLKDDLVNGIIILEDNSIDRIFDDTIPYDAVTEEHLLGLDLSHSSFFKQAGFKDTVYLGILSNSPRIDMAIRYLEYLFADAPDVCAVKPFALSCFSSAMILHGGAG